MPDKTSPSAIARDVLQTEGQALLGLRDALPPAFDTVIEALLGVPGRVIVSGMGKSGHIAAKIAATIAGVAQAVEVDANI